MIICASRRTDIPAFHSEWFMNRLRAGYVHVRNPMCRNLVHRVSMERSDVDCILFMTKNPIPMECNLKEIGKMGYMYTFQVTLNPYGKDLEPGVPSKADINDCCIRIAERIGRDRMVWRYDPVIFNRYIGMQYHERKFEMMCKEASQWTDRCVISFVELYGKLSDAVNNGLLRSVSKSEMESFSKTASRIAEKYGISVSQCCAKQDMSPFGVSNRGCIDKTLMRSLDIPCEMPSKPNREGCRCVKSIDIGQYDTCLHECVYCYANREYGGERLRRVYNPMSEMLWGELSPRDELVDLFGEKVSKITDFDHS